MLELELGLGLGVTLHYYFLAHLAEERGEPVVALGAAPWSRLGVRVRVCVRARVRVGIGLGYG